jgi:hypothetical protein
VALLQGFTFSRYWVGLGICIYNKSLGDAFPPGLWTKLKIKAISSTIFRAWASFFECPSVLPISFQILEKKKKISVNIGVEIALTRLHSFKSKREGMDINKTLSVTEIQVKYSADEVANYSWKFGSVYFKNLNFGVEARLMWSSAYLASTRP